MTKCAHRVVNLANQIPILVELINKDGATSSTL